MDRLAHIVVPGVPHHVTQRGNRRQEVFFGEEDYAAYKALVAEACSENNVRCLAWCLMPNHVHLILVPSTADGLRAALADAHRRYSRRINFARGWTGYLWQGRFASYPMDDAHLMTAVRYVELNPVKAKLARRAEEAGELGIASPELKGNNDWSKQSGQFDGSSVWRLSKDWRWA